MKMRSFSLLMSMILNFSFISAWADDVGFGNTDEIYLGVTWSTDNRLISFEVITDPPRSHVYDIPTHPFLREDLYLFVQARRFVDAQMKTDILKMLREEESIVSAVESTTFLPEFEKVLKEFVKKNTMSD